MEYKDYYKTMGVARDASADDVKTAYRKLSRKYHPDVSKEKNAEAQFKDVAEAYGVLKDADKRAAYDQLGADWQGGQAFRPPPGWNPRQQRAPAGTGRNAGASAFDGFDGFDPDDFESLFRSMGGQAGAGGRQGGFDRHGQDQHAKIQISIEDSYLGATRTLQLRVPEGDGVANRTIEFAIPQGIRAGQHIRLSRQGTPGSGQGIAGDLYLDVEFLPHLLYRAEGHDVYMDLPVSPWEAVLGAEVDVPTPTGTVQLTIPPGSGAGRKLRLKGRGLPGKLPGDFYFVLKLALPPAATPAARQAYADLATAFASFNPRASLPGAPP